MHAYSVGYLEIYLSIILLSAGHNIFLYFSVLHTQISEVPFKLFP